MGGNSTVSSTSDPFMDTGDFQGRKIRTETRMASTVLQDVTNGKRVPSGIGAKEFNDRLRQVRSRHDAGSGSCGVQANTTTPEINAKASHDSPLILPSAVSTAVQVSSEIRGQVNSVNSQTDRKGVRSDSGDVEDKIADSQKEDKSIISIRESSELRVTASTELDSHSDYFAQGLVSSSNHTRLSRKFSDPSLEIVSTELKSSDVKVNPRKRRHSYNAVFIESMKCLQEPSVGDSTAKRDSAVVTNEELESRVICEVKEKITAEPTVGTSAAGEGSMADFNAEVQRQTLAAVDETVEESESDNSEDSTVDKQEDAQAGDKRDVSTGEILNQTAQPAQPAPSRADVAYQTTEDSEILEEIEEFKRQFVSISKDYKILDKIGQGTFSCVFKAEDLTNRHHLSDDSWQSPSLKKIRKSRATEDGNTGKSTQKLVALKRIHVTSSPNRIFNELNLLYSLSGCKWVSPIIDAMRYEDQIVAVLPYYEHCDFRDYYRKLDLFEIQAYMKELFSGLLFIHSKGIIHRDVKPTNFLFNPTTKRGVLVDFGLAEVYSPREVKHCPCRSKSLPRKTMETPVGGYLKDDSRPRRRANRAGTRGFRAPEVLFKCPNQSTKIDIWAAGVILLSFLTQRFPFFYSTDDTDALIEIATIFGRKAMQQAAHLHGLSFEITIPTVLEKGYPFEEIVEWALELDYPVEFYELEKAQKTLIKEGLNNSSKRITKANDVKPPFMKPTPFRAWALEMLQGCLELDPAKRWDANMALLSSFVRFNGEFNPENEVDLVV